MKAALARSRAPGAIRAPLGAMSVPVLYRWRDADDTVGQFAAEQADDRVNGLVLGHLTRRDHAENVGIAATTARFL
jgi:hypothetical protein